MSNGGIEIRFDDVSGDYYIIWELPRAIGLGGTEVAALHDLRQAAHLCIDLLIEQKLKEVAKEV